MQQAVKFAARLDRTAQMADMFADGLHGMTAASDALKKVMDEFGIQVHSIVTVRDIREYLAEKPEYAGVLEHMDRYMEQYCRF